MSSEWEYVWQIEMLQVVCQLECEGCFVGVDEEVWMSAM